MKILLWLEYTPRKVGHEEEITRFVFVEKYIKNGVKWAAFKPASDGDTSVYRIKKLCQEIIWFLGHQYVEKRHRSKKKIYGRADLDICKVADLLTLAPTLSPHPRHLNLRNWPDRESSKDKLFQLQLAHSARAISKYPKVDK